MAMKQALISPNEPVSYISGWTDVKPYQPIYSVIPDAARVAEVCDVDFPIAPPLFWVDCADDVVADQWYYNKQTQQIILVPPPAPRPDATVTGAQTL
jgi:hypothetical protein